MKAILAAVQNERLAVLSLRGKRGESRWATTLIDDQRWRQMWRNRNKLQNMGLGRGFRFSRACKRSLRHLNVHGLAFRTTRTATTLSTTYSNEPNSVRSKVRLYGDDCQIIIPDIARDKAF